MYLVNTPTPNSVTDPDAKKLKDDGNVTGYTILHEKLS